MSRIACLAVTVFAVSSLCWAQMAQQPGLPFEINGLQLESNVVTKEVSLHFTLSNPTHSRLKQITLGILTWDSPDHPRAFDLESHVVDIPPGADRELILPLSSLLYNELGDALEFSVAVAQARTESDGWETTLPPRGFAAALKAGRPIPIQPAAAGEAGQCPGICVDCRNEARCICGQQIGCIENFSCSLGTCSCSFACNTHGVGCSPPSNCQ